MTPEQVYHKWSAYLHQIDRHDFREQLESIASTPSSARIKGGIYVASRVKHAEIWKSYRAYGWPITATWIDEAGEGETADFGDLWERIWDEIYSSDCLVLYAAGMEDFPFKGALVEVGMALAMRKRVLVALEDVTLEGRTMRPVGSWLFHRNVIRYDTLKETMDVAHGISGLCRQPAMIYTENSGGSRNDTSRTGAARSCRELARQIEWALVNSDGRDFRMDASFARELIDALGAIASSEHIYTKADMEAACELVRAAGLKADEIRAGKT